MKNAYLAIGAAVIIVLIAGYYLLAQTQKTTTQTPSPTPTLLATDSAQQGEKNLVEAQDQPATNTIVTSLVRSEKPGFIAIHLDQNGQPGNVIGNSELFPAGENRNVIVTLTQSLKPGNVVYAMYHTDANGNGVYNFPGDDAPVKDSTGTTVMARITIL